VLASVPVVIYALTGAAVWQFWVRPMEERDLLARHGEPYARYRRQVSCWWPRRHTPQGPAYAPE
jgi:protein-S-isoprenylcysteine O-methyltransferase Ste14